MNIVIVPGWLRQTPVQGSGREQPGNSIAPCPAQPPADLQDWHRTTAKQLDDGAKALKANEFDDPALEALGDSPLPNMPEGPRARLQKIAETAPECKATNPFES